VNMWVMITWRDAKSATRFSLISPSSNSVASSSKCRMNLRLQKRPSSFPEGGLALEVTLGTGTHHSGVSFGWLLLTPLGVIDFPFYLFDLIVVPIFLFLSFFYCCLEVHCSEWKQRGGGGGPKPGPNGVERGVEGRVEEILLCFLFFPKKEVFKEINIFPFIALPFPFPFLPLTPGIEYSNYHNETLFVPA